MDPFNQGAVHEIPNDTPTVHAFRIVGTLGQEASEALAAHMNAAFDAQDSVSMLFDLSAFKGSEGTSIFNGEVLKSRLRSVGKIDRYAVIGAPEAAERMIAAMDTILPVDARTFDAGAEDEAWAFVGARPL